MSGRVLLVTSNYPRWAGDSTTPFVHDIARDLTDLGWVVTVLAPHAPGASRHEWLDGIEIIRFRYMPIESMQTVCYQGGALINLRKRPLDKLKLPFLVLAEILSIRRLLRQRTFDLVNAHWILPQGFCATLASGRLPVAITVHGGDVFALSGRLMSAFKRYVLHRADLVLVNSGATRAAVTALTDNISLLQTIPVGISTERPDPGVVADMRQRLGGKPLLLFLGRLIREKGIFDFIEALPEIARELPEMRAVIVGDGQDAAAARDAVEGEGLGSKVTFAGWVSPEEARNYLAGADIFVGPSRNDPSGWTEAMGLAFREAMYAGTAVVASNVGGIPETVRHEETGLLVPDKNPSEIASAVTRVWTDSDLRGSLVATAEAVAETSFTRPTCARKLDESFSALLQSENVASDESSAGPPATGILAPGKVESDITAVPRRNWKQIGKNLVVRIPVLREVVHRMVAWSRSGSFSGSSDYWENRYADSGNSGSGSYGRLAQFKAEVINNFVRQDSVRNVVELGCGDGNQLTMMEYASYVGVDVSPTAVQVCREKFADKPEWAFFEIGETERYAGPFDLALSLDVIYHLVEDAIFDEHMRQLFSLSNRFVIVYSTNHDDNVRDPHVRHRRFTDWVSENQPGWIQISHVANRYPFDPADPDNTSDADFFVFARHAA